MKAQSFSLQFPPIALKKNLSYEVVEEDQIIIIQVGFILYAFTYRGIKCPGSTARYLK